MPKTASGPSSSVSVAPLRSTAAGIDPDGALHGMGLLAHRLDEARQQPGAVVRYHHGGDDVTEVRCVL